MREKVNAEQLERFMKAIGHVSKNNARIYLVGGASAVLLGWRDSTIDIDLKMVPEVNQILRTLPELKELLHVNIELASPDDFIPALPGWEERSGYITRQGKIEFFHYDFYAQALAKIERGHSNDMLDVRKMIEQGLVEPTRLLDLFGRIEDDLYKYPALDEKSFRNEVERVVAEAQEAQ
ncbi:MAG TPA: DUF6036 family nucleotidyltransferase [Pyrinomonadaceae bacterium]|jgi:hypothetical protein|nr:DUF6036 family nucleotidyltransferase [Pyrinomonadaceae bacterium]